MPVLPILVAIATFPALVNGKPITEPEVVKAMRDRIRKTTFHKQLDDQQIAELRRTILEELITAELRAQEARRRGLSVPQEPIEKIAAAEEKNAGGHEKFDAVLANYGIDRGRYLEILSRPALSDRLAQAEAATTMPVSIDEALAHYQANPSIYLVPGALWLRETCVRVDPSSGEEKWKAAEVAARDLRARALTGNFAAIAAAQKCDAFAAKGGDLGIVHKGSLDPVMESAAWRLGDGEVSEPIRALRGWYLIKRDATQAARQATFEEVRTSILARLRDERNDAALRKLDERLRAAATIVVAKQ
jgi:parvulin-like peptidyl-prolyl isomerase